jgi:membrane protein
VRLLGGGDLPFKVFVQRVYRNFVDHSVTDTAATLSYYFIFSLFPFLFFLATLTAYLPLKGTVDMLIDRVRPVLPSEAVDLIHHHLTALIAQPRPRLITISLLFTLYSASRGIDAVRKGLNLAYDVTEKRPWWITELMAFGATIGGALLLLFGVAGLVAGGDAGSWIARHMGLEMEYLFVWRWARWPVTASAVMLCAAMSYYFLPNVQQKFKYITPGSVLGTLSWLGASYGFSVYVGHFGRYNVTYGSIGGVIILMTWFFISGFIFLMGGEINAILEQASPEGKRAGARAEGQRPPPPRERPSAMPAGAAAHASVAERSPGGVQQDSTHP